MVRQSARFQRLWLSLRYSASMPASSVLPPAIAIVPAHSAAQLADIRALFVEYQRDLGIDLCFQGFQQEIDTLPGGYSEPAGGLFLATVGKRAVNPC